MDKGPSVPYTRGGRVVVLPDQPSDICQVVNGECQDVHRRFLHNDPHKPEPLLGGKEATGLCAACLYRARYEEHDMFIPNMSPGVAEVINSKIRATYKKLAEEDPKHQLNVTRTAEIEKTEGVKLPRSEVLVKRLPDTDIDNKVLQWVLSAKPTGGLSTWYNPDQAMQVRRLISDEVDDRVYLSST